MTGKCSDLSWWSQLWWIWLDLSESSNDISLNLVGGWSPGRGVLLIFFYMRFMRSILSFKFIFVFSRALYKHAIFAKLKLRLLMYRIWIILTTLPSPWPLFETRTNTNHSSYIVKFYLLIIRNSWVPFCFWIKINLMIQFVWINSSCCFLQHVCFYLAVTQLINSSPSVKF